MEVRALLDLGDVAKATRKLDDLAERVGWRWRLVWYRAVAELLTGDYDSAIKHFTEVLDTFPGELAPKLALAATAELAGNVRRAEVSTETVWGTNDGVISAAFGLPDPQSAEVTGSARCGTLDEVQPATSRHFTTARLTSAVTLLSGRLDELRSPRSRSATHARRVEALPPPSPGCCRSARWCWAARWTGWTTTGQHEPHPRIPCSPNTVCGLAWRRRCAAWPASPPPSAHRYTLVDMANRSARPAPSRPFWHFRPVRRPKLAGRAHRDVKGCVGYGTPHQDCRRQRGLAP